MDRALKLLWVIAALAIVTPASAQGTPPKVSPDRQYTGDLVDRSTAIEGCIEDVQDMRDTGDVPEVFARHKGRLRDIKRQLQKEKFSNWKDLMWGAAIRLCMQDKGYHSTCVTKRGRDGELQFLETAKAPSCWDQASVEEPAKPVHPSEERGDFAIEVRPDPTPTIQPQLPHMSPADMAQFKEDGSIISQAVTIIGDDEGGAKEARFSSCASYWQSLHHNRSPEARQLLYAVRVARCMFRTNYALMRTRSGCHWEHGGQWGWQQAVSILLQSRCYARF